MGLAPGPYEISRTQAGMGHEVTVFCGGNRASVPEGIPGARIIALPRGIKGVVAFTSAPALLLRFFFHQARHPIDVIHGHAQVTQWFNLWRLLFGGRTPYFYHLHITFAGREAHCREKGIRFSWGEKINNWGGKLADAWGCRVADHIFATNESVKEEAVRHLAVAPERITVLKNGVNTDLFRPREKDAALLARLGFRSGDRIILYVGVLNPRKNVGVLFDALARLPPDLHLLLAGDGPAAHVETLRARLRALNMESRVKFAGYVAYPDLPPYYALADIFVLPSLYEGFPKVLLEALASGKRSIVHAGYALDPDLESFVDKVDCTDAAALAGCIGDTADKPFKGDHAGFTRRFSWRAITGHMVEAYQRHL
jgi:glycosyltransferase involved in cell wall biosynthesis